MRDLRVVIGILTFRRNDDLAALLAALPAQILAVDDKVEVLVVDNDPDGGARGTVEAAGIGARYVHEPRPGIEAARNRVLDEVAGYDILVFIDDDELPSPSWLPLLLAQYRVDEPFAVVGAVVAGFRGPVDPWVEAGRFFVRKRWPTGTLVPAAGTGNLLLDLAQVQVLGLRFDERYSLTGGGDSLFTRQAVARGARLVWCDEAPIADMVPAARATRKWVLRRAFRSGNSWTLTALEVEPEAWRRWLMRARFAVMGAGRVVVGSLRWAFGIATRSLRHQARGARTASRGAGLLAGLVGHRCIEYARPASGR